jgi:hypothetical protein
MKRPFRSFGPYNQISVEMTEGGRADHVGVEVYSKGITYASWENEGRVV